MPPHTPPPTPLARLDIAAKGGPWAMWQRLQPRENRRRAFSYALLNPDYRLDDTERLGRMRALVDMGLWGDHDKPQDKRMFQEARRMLGYDLLRTQRERLLSVEALHLAMEAGVDPNWHEQNHYDDSLLTLFARHNLPDCLERVLDAGANPNWRDTCDNTALHILIEHAGTDEGIKANMLPMVEALLRRGVDINSAGDNRHDHDHGKPPIKSAIEAWDVDLVRWMLGRGARLDGVDAYGDTVFHWAATARRGWGERDVGPMMNLLLQHGAVVNAVNQRGETPVWSAMKWGHVDAGRWLLEHGASRSCVPHTFQDPQGYEFPGKNGPGLLQVFCQNIPRSEEAIEALAYLLEPGTQAWHDATPEGMPLHELLRSQDSQWLAFIEAGLLDQEVATVNPQIAPTRARPRL